MSSKTIQAPAAPVAPSAGETSAQAIQAQIDALPKILAAQQQYGGAFSQQNLDQLNQFAPAFAQQEDKILTGQVLDRFSYNGYSSGHAPMQTRKRQC